MSEILKYLSFIKLCHVFAGYIGLKWPFVRSHRCEMGKKFASSLLAGKVVFR